MAFLAYYDGSGTHSSAKALTLAGFAGPEGVWSLFREQWLTILSRHAVSKLHMRKLSQSFRRGDENARRLVIDFFNVIGTFRQEHLTAYSCTILMEGYRGANRILKTLKPAEAICVDFCVGGLYLTADDLAEPGPIIIHFDGNERFLRYIYRAWQLARRRNPKAEWARQIRDVRSVRGELPEIQAADLLAWIVNRYHTQEDNAFWAASTIVMAKHISQIYDCDGLLRVYDSTGMRSDRPQGNFRPLSIRLS